MKQCPNCGEYVGDSVTVCFNCRYNFLTEKVLNTDELVRRREQEAMERAEYQKKFEEKEKRKKEQLLKNPEYEYYVIAINDLPTGEADINKIQNTLIEYSQKGWKLAFSFTNEIGKSVAGSMTRFFDIQINATIDQTILIFERCIKS